MGFLSKLLGSKTREFETTNRELQPANELERSLQALIQGKGGIEEVVAVLMKSKLFFPSLSDPGKSTTSSGVQPVVIELSEGTFTAAFTAPERAETLSVICPEAVHGLLVDAGWVLQCLPPSQGLYLNPGWNVGLMIPPQGVAGMKDIQRVE